MSKLSYPAYIERTPSGGCCILFPDIPACIGAGATATAAVRAAQDALALYLEGLVRDGAEIPAASDLGDLDPAMTEDVIGLVLVEAAEPTISERVNVWLPKLLLQRIDQHLAEQGFNRSAFLANAARAALREGAAQAVAERYGVVDAYRTVEVGVSESAPAPGTDWVLSAEADA